MKRYPLILFCLWSICLLQGCGGTSSAADADAAHEPFIALSVRTEPDLAHAAYTVEELYADSDVVVEGVVKSVSGTNDTLYYSGMVYTQMQIEPIAVYKGQYENETLWMCGGTMPLSTYVLNLEPDHPDKTVSYSAEEWEYGMVSQQFANNSAPQAGDRILFFGARDENDANAFRNTNVTQGIYLCDDETLSTSALLVDENGFTEPLAKDILARCGGTVAAPMEENGLSILTFDRKAFLEIIG